MNSAFKRVIVLSTGANNTKESSMEVGWLRGAASLLDEIASKFCRGNRKLTLFSFNIKSVFKEPLYNQFYKLNVFPSHYKTNGNVI